MISASNAKSRHHNEWSCICNSNEFSLFQLHHEWRYSQLIATNFRKKQSSACIWSFEIKCSSLTIRQLRQCIWCISIECSHLTSTDKIVNAFDRSESDAVVWHQNNRQCIWWHRHQMQRTDIKTISSVHLIISTSDAAILIFHSIVNASDDIDIRCSSGNFINKQSSACIWSFYDRAQQFWHHIQPSVHLMTSASDAAFLTSKSTVCLFIVW